MRMTFVESVDVSFLHRVRLLLNIQQILGSSHVTLQQDVLRVHHKDVR